LPKIRENQILKSGIVVRARTEFSAESSAFYLFSTEQGDVLETFYIDGDPREPVVTERVGRVGDVQKFLSADDLITHILGLVAVTDVRVVPIKDQDPLRALHEDAVAMVSKVSEEYGQKLSRQYEEEVKQKPYDDMRRTRTQYAIDLTKEGLSFEKAKKIALEKYPLPMIS
jgi:hypothetical protein